MFKELWAKIKSIFVKVDFGDILKQIFTSTLKLVLSSAWTIALKVVQDVNASDLTDNDEKRKLAFGKMKEIATTEGLTLKDSLVSLLLELAVTFIKVSIVK